MTEQESKEFFQWVDRPLAMTYGRNVDGGIDVETLYQAFKARLKSEATCNCWAKEAV